MAPSLVLRCSIDKLDKLVIQYPKTPEYWLQRGKYKLEKDFLPGAEKDFDKVLSLDEDFEGLGKWAVIEKAVEGGADKYLALQVYAGDDQRPWQGRLGHQDEPQRDACARSVLVRGHDPIVCTYKCVLGTDTRGVDSANQRLRGLVALSNFHAPFTSTSTETQ